MHSTQQLQGIGSLHGTLFTYRKIAATLRHTKELQIGVTTGARRLILTREFLAAHFLEGLESGWSQIEAMEEANSWNKLSCKTLESIRYRQGRLLHRINWFMQPCGVPASHVTASSYQLRLRSGVQER